MYTINVNDLCDEIEDIVGMIKKSKTYDKTIEDYRQSIRIIENRLASLVISCRMANPK